MAAKNNRDPATRLRLPIVDETKTEIGELLCVDRVMAGHDDIVARLTDWRNENKASFLTQFDATNARTQAWLQNIVLPSADRILFLIADGDGSIIGNAGLCHVAHGSAELDNILRGRPSRYRRIAFYALAALTGWVFRALKANIARLHVFSANARAIRLYESLGFDVSGVHRLSQQTDAQGTRYLVDCAEGMPTDFDYLEMTLSAADFYRLHPWASPA